jgi:hypothetical protein
MRRIYGPFCCRRNRLCEPLWRCHSGDDARRRIAGTSSELDSKDAIKLATAIVATLSALPLGLLVASAKTSFDTADTQLRNSIARTVLLDRVMAHYGPETREAHVQLRQVVETSLRQFWGGTGGTNPNAVGDDPGVESVQDKLRAIAPQTETQRWLLSRALQISGDIAEAHWLMFERSEAGFPWPFLILVFCLVASVCWRLGMPPFFVLFSSALFRSPARSF